MANIKEVSFENNTITFNCKKEELANLNISGTFIFFDNSKLKKEIYRIVKRGRDESTFYLLLDKFIKDFLSEKFKTIFKKENKVYLDGGILEVEKDKYMVVKL